MAVTYLLQHLLADAACRFGQRTAVIADDASLTYEQLDRLSNQLCRALQARGVGLGDRVGILARKSAAGVVAIFAALKSGACYVPLDPGSPDERLRFVMADCDLSVVLSDRGAARRALELAGSVRRHPWHVAVEPGSGAAEPRSDTVESGSATVESGSDTAGSGPDSYMGGAETVPWAAIRAESADPPPAIGAIDADLAYLLYTSGSTGVPKGVMISHRASLNFVDWACSCVGLDQGDRVCCPAPLHFDLSVFDVFASCRAGACMVVAPALALMFPVRLAEWIERQRVSVWYSVPSLLAMLAVHGNLSARDLSALRAVIFAGEVFPAKHLSLLMEQLPHARHLNWYGPTETNVCTWYEVPRAGAAPTAPVPIGRACANVDVFALSAEGRRLELPGEQGELFVRGSGLMSGYWGQSQMTTEALVANPLADAREEQVYRTGDMVSVDADGNYLFLGRIDGMVKTRGYRVELGEVETVLYEHPAVREAVALPLPDELVGNRLRAVVCAENAVSREDLLEHCRRRLPGYMVPDVIEFCSTLPRTSTGKVDRMLLRSG